MDAAGGFSQMLHIAGITQRHKLLVGILIRSITFRPSFFIICLLRQRRMVTCRFQHTDFVFYLHHDDHLALWVTLLDMPQERRKSFQVSLRHIVAEARGNLHLLSLGGHRPWEPLRILLKPPRCIARHRVLPCTEPEEHHLQLLPSRHVDGTVDKCEVELPLCWFHQFPIGWHEHRVQSQRPHPGHHLVDVFHRRRR